MLTHAEIWNALDRLAAKTGATPSGLARGAGLDPTSFNPSKRVSANGKARWPSTESLSKVLVTVGVSFEDFAALAAGNGARGRPVPVIGMAQAGDSGYFDDSGFPIGGGWDEVQVPNQNDNNVYALEIVGDSMDPLFRAGDRVLVAPNQTVRKGDRVVVKTIDGEVMAKELYRLTATKVELRSVNPEYDDRILRRRDIEWIARIVWVSQ